MKTLAILLVILAVTNAVGAEHFRELGHREDTVMRSDPGDQCLGVPIYNHDFSCENAYCWQGSAAIPPYYGAFGEAFDLGCANVECGLYWFTQIGYYTGGPIDVYVWDNGVPCPEDPPGDVLCVVPGVSGLHVECWPACTLNEIQIGCRVDGPFTVGYWTEFCCCELYICADENGSGGCPWTCIAPGIGFPTGWHPVYDVWQDCVSLCIGATIIDDPSPAPSRTWGSIKELFE